MRRRQLSGATFPVRLMMAELARRLAYRLPRGKPEPSGEFGVIEAAVANVPDLLLSLSSSLDGIRHVHTLWRQGQDGLNEIASEKPPRWYFQLPAAFHTPFTYLPLTLAAVALCTKDFTGAMIISIMVAISGLLRVKSVTTSGWPRREHCSGNKWKQCPTWSWKRRLRKLCCSPS
jgi:hypothetical protein